MLADWPGQSKSALYERGDLKPTADLRSVFKGLLAAQFRLPNQVLEREIFPGSAGARSLQGLVSYVGSNVRVD